MINDNTAMTAVEGGPEQESIERSVRHFAASFSDWSLGWFGLQDGPSACRHPIEDEDEDESKRARVAPERHIPPSALAPVGPANKRPLRNGHLRTDYLCTHSGQMF